MLQSSSQEYCFALKSETKLSSTMASSWLREDDLHLQVHRNYHFEISPNLVLLLSRPWRINTVIHWVKVFLIASAMYKIDYADAAH